MYTYVHYSMLAVIAVQAAKNFSCTGAYRTVRAEGML
jgi:hypothetical protein